MGASTTPGADEPDVHPLFGVFPIAVLLGGLLAVVRALLERSAAVGRGLDPEAAGFRLLARAAGWPEHLTEGLLAGLVAALLLTYAVASRRGTFVSLALGGTLLAVGAYLSGYPEPLPGITPPIVAASVACTVLAFGLARARFAGPFALAAALVLGVGGPIALGQWYRRAQPGMPVREVLVDLVATPGVTTVLQQRAGRPVEPGVLTPAKDQRTDTGDKPSLVMTPPAALQFVVPATSEGARLELAAGADESLFRHAPAGVDVVYRVVIDDEVAWETTYEHRPVPPGPAFDTTGQVWRHAGVDGERGLPVRAGQMVRLETAWGDLRPDEGVADALRVGFGGAQIVRVGRRPREVAMESAPNIVFIVMDTQRADRMGCYGYGRDTTPNVDRLAARGLRFADAYSTSSWTWPSTASLHTGLLPDSHGVRGADACTLSQRFETLAEALQARGYTTAAFVGNPIVDPDRYFDQGFERFAVEKDSLLAAFRMSDEVVPPALVWLERNAPLRFFLYLHLVDPHTPHRPDPREAERLGMVPRPVDWPERGLDGVPHHEEPSAATRQYVNDLYDASVATGDRWVGAVLAKLDELGLADRTVVCFTADHGEELFDHGDHGHGHAVWNELVHVPLVLAGPGIPTGVRRGAVSNRFVPTTLASLAGTALEVPGATVDLVADPCPGEALFSTTKGVWGTARYQTLYGLRRDVAITHWRASVLEPGDVAEADLRRFDALSDPGQRTDLVPILGAETRSDVARMQELIEEAAEARPPLVLGVGEGGRGTLRNIGYAGDDPGPGDR